MVYTHSLFQHANSCTCRAEALLKYGVEDDDRMGSVYLAREVAVGSGEVVDEDGIHDYFFIHDGPLKVTQMGVLLRLRLPCFHASGHWPARWPAQSDKDLRSRHGAH